MTDPTQRGPSLQDDLFGTEAEAEHETRTPRIGWEPPRELMGCRTLSTVGIGAATFVLIDAVMMWAPLLADPSADTSPQAVTLAFLAFGLGSLLIWRVRGAWRPYGVGLMIGWAFLTLLSAGFLTGVSP